MVFSYLFIYILVERLIIKVIIYSIFFFLIEKIYLFKHILFQFSIKLLVIRPIS
jgi:hypothetical protein